MRKSYDIFKYTIQFDTISNKQYYITKLHDSSENKNIYAG